MRTCLPSSEQLIWTDKKTGKLQTLVGFTQENLVPYPLAVQSLNNQVYQLSNLEKKYLYQFWELEKVLIVFTKI